MQNGDKIVVHYNRLKRSKTTGCKRRAVKTLTDLDKATRDTATEITVMPELEHSCSQGHHDTTDNAYATPSISQSVLIPVSGSMCRKEIDAEDLDENAAAIQSQRIEEDIPDEPARIDEIDQPLDPSDPEWEPPRTTRIEPLVQNNYNLCPRDHIVAPCRCLD